MEPLGTITQYFPVIDEETKKVLENIMDEASDYYDFVHRLGKLVLKTNSPIMVVWFSIHHAIQVSEYKLIDMIGEKYGTHDILGPHLYFSSAFQGTFEDVKYIHEKADAILATEPEDWIALEMNFMKIEADMRNYPTTMYPSSIMESIQVTIDENPQFGFYDISVCDYLALRAHTDGDTEERLRCLNRGIEVCEKYDDQLRKVDFLLKKGLLLKDRNLIESKELLEKAYQINDTSLGVPVYYADAIESLGVIDMIRGEFDNAIRHFLQVVTIRERAGLNTGNASSYLSIIYNVTADAESGLEWACMAEDQYKSRPYLINRAILYQVWSLILLKRATEAQILIDASRESIMKSGDESQLAWFYFVTGIMEMEQDRLDLASSSIEQALRIYESQGWGYQLQLIFLHHLAKIEVYSYENESDLTPSLAILEDKALTDDLPGHIGHILLLKADLAIRRNDDAELRGIIQQLQPLTEKEGLQFLKPLFERLMQKI